MLLNSLERFGLEKLRKGAFGVENFFRKALPKRQRNLSESRWHNNKSHHFDCSGRKRHQEFQMRRSFHNKYAANGWDARSLVANIGGRNISWLSMASLQTIP